MNLAVVLVVAAVLALGIILRLAVKQGLQAKVNTSLAVSIRPIDIEAFRNLIDPAEDEYLRRRLPAAQFRAVRRERLRATAAYVQIVAGNAAALVRAGETALASGDPRFTAAARKLVNDALLLRRNASLALLRIYLALAWPTSGCGAAHLVDRYENLSGSAMLLGRLHNPGVPVRLSTMF